MGVQESWSDSANTVDAVPAKGSAVLITITVGPTDIRRWDDAPAGSERRLSVQLNLGKR